MLPQVVAPSVDGSFTEYSQCESMFDYSTNYLDVTSENSMETQHLHQHTLPHHHHNNHHERRRLDQRIERRMKAQLRNEAEWSKTMTRYRVRMQRIGLMQMVLAVICTIVTFAITTFEFKESPATGIWCSIFFAAVGGLVHTASKMNRSFRVMVTFGVTNIYFGFLMFFVEFVESGVGYQHRFELSLEMTYHVIMCAFAIFQVMLTILAIYLCRRHDGAQIKQKNYMLHLKRQSAADQLAVVEMK